MYDKISYLINSLHRGTQTDMVLFTDDSSLLFLFSKLSPVFETYISKYRGLCINRTESRQREHSFKSGIIKVIIYLILRYSNVFHYIILIKYTSRVKENFGNSNPKVYTFTTRVNGKSYSGL